MDVQSSEDSQKSWPAGWIFACRPAVVHPYPEKVKEAGSRWSRIVEAPAQQRIGQIQIAVFIARVWPYSRSGISQDTGEQNCHTRDNSVAEVPVGNLSIGPDHNTERRSGQKKEYPHRDAWVVEEICHRQHEADNKEPQTRYAVRELAALSVSWPGTQHSRPPRLKRNLFTMHVQDHIFSRKSLAG